jgi:hypothetical protein
MVASADQMAAADHQGSAAVAANQAAKRPAEDQKWCKVYGRCVDLDSLRHPGGNIIQLFYGLDATNAFEQFHGHSQKALKMLRALPDKRVDPADIVAQPDEHVRAMSRLMASWRERGLFKPRPLVSSAYGLGVVLTIAASVMCCAYAPVLCGLVVGTMWAHCGFLQHMGGHREWGARWSFFWQHFFEGLMKGGSASWWRNRHNKHHAKTNVLGEDGDLRTTPFFAWDETLAKKVPDWSLRTQAFTFLPALGAYVFVFAFTVRKVRLVGPSAHMHSHVHRNPRRRAMLAPPEPPQAHVPHVSPTTHAPPAAHAPPA